MSQNIATELIPIPLEAELKKSYLDYAMSVIISRALPDIRDGLKPVHRRVLYAMDGLNNAWNKPYKKSARIVGDVLGKYHPHGEATYDAVVRMAQFFSMRYPLIDGQGNFGSIDGDDPAAMRYTEVRMSLLAHALLSDLDKDTVGFVPNYDGHEQEPKVLPTRIPNLLVNGTSGIAVGMATNIPPHNLGEIINASIALLQDPMLETEQLIAYVPGPDFPTGAIIQGRSGILEAYATGRGRVTMRAVTNIEEDEKTYKQKIIVSQLPYQVNKARLVEKIAELVRDKRIEGITALRDESDKDGMRIVIELRRGDVHEVVLNNLFTHTALQTHFHVNMVALDGGRPVLCTLKKLLEAFLRHRREVITRRTLFELKQAKEKAHLLEGLSVALANIDEVIQTIKTAPDTASAKLALIQKNWPLGAVKALLTVAKTMDAAEKNYQLQADETYRLSERQAQAILDLRLHRLTGLEQGKLLQDYQTQIDLIKALLNILHNSERLNEVLREELMQIKESFADPRRTQIVDAAIDLDYESLIPQEERVVTLSHEGYTKTQSLSSYQAQRRGGKGKLASDIKEADFISQFIIANSHVTLLCFSSAGKAYWLKTYQLPQGSRTARGRPIINLLPLKEGEKIHALLPVSAYVEDQYILMVTAKGFVKKTSLIDFSRPRKDGITAIDLDEDDHLIGVALTNGEKDVLIFTDAGKVIRFQEKHVRCMGRTARGVRGIRLKENQSVISLIIAEADREILTVTEKGYGKRTSIAEYRVTGRGGQGVVAIKTGERNGKIVAALQVSKEDEIMLITNNANVVRTAVKGIRSTGRVSQGVRVMRLEGSEALVAIQCIADE